MSVLPPRPMRSLENRVAIVTGAGSAGDGIGNGRAAALLLAEAGCAVVCVDMSQESAQLTVSMIESEGKGRAAFMTGDVSDEAVCKSIVDKTISIYGHLDILVNNVGILGARGNATEVDMAGWETGMRVNVGSMVMMSKYAIPQMSKNEGEYWRGSVVNVGSVAGLMGGAPNLLYATSKGAVGNLTRAMAHHHAPERIRVNAVAPGMLYTPMVCAGNTSTGFREACKQGSILKTEGNGWDCGSAVRFLASDEARWITGIILTVDAGLSSSLNIDFN